MQHVPVQKVKTYEDKPNPGTKNDVVLSPLEGEMLPIGCPKYWSPTQQMSYYLNPTSGQIVWKPEGTTHENEMR